MVSYQYAGLIPKRIATTELSTMMDSLFPCKDGWFRAWGNGLIYWPKLVKAVGEPKILKDPKWMAFFNQSGYGFIDDSVDKNPNAMKEEFDGFFYPWALEHTKAELWPLFQKHGIISGPCNTIKDTFNCPHLKEREFWVEIDHPETGKLQYPGRPFLMSDTPYQLKRWAPLLGEHNKEVYGQLGYSTDDLVTMKQKGEI
jgi:crotonobetainyl-CoA:carnitine CoA-transferase CaiB-like acyl-CoA transferase